MKLNGHNHSVLEISGAHSSESRATEDGRVRFADSEAFVRSYGAIPLEQYQPEFKAYLHRIRKFVELKPGARLLEVGVGSGWFMLLCQREGMVCEGIEHNPFCIQTAKDLGHKHGIDLEIREGSIENAALPENRYDVVVAMSVLEHVRDYRAALQRIYYTLRPGGAFFFSSTNKFSFRSGEYPLPLYGWLPYRLRRTIRVRRQGPLIVDSGGIDFNQFTYFGLRRALGQAGFSEIYDRFDLLRPDDVTRRTAPRLLTARFLRAVAPLRVGARIIDSSTYFIAVK